MAQSVQSKLGNLNIFISPWFKSQERLENYLENRLRAVPNL
jgi:hypothetical protein